MAMKASLPNWADPAVQRRGARLVSVLLAVLIAWQLSRVFWLVLQPPNPEPVVSLQPGPALRPEPGQTDIAALHLFGMSAPHPVVSAWREAPETALQLQLRGIVASGDPDDGFAIIVAQGRQASYRVGETLPGPAEVRGIYPDRVVLFHQGRYETLRLPVASAVAAGEPPASDSRVGEPVAEEPGLPLAASAAGWNERLSLNLGERANYSLIPVRGGGYRLFLGRDSQTITGAGLRNGDVIRSANGLALDSQANVESVLSQLLSGQTVTLLIERDGETISLTPDIEPFLSGVR